MKIKSRTKRESAEHRKEYSISPQEGGGTSLNHYDISFDSASTDTDFLMQVVHNMTRLGNPTKIERNRKEGGQLKAATPRLMQGLQCTYKLYLSVHIANWK